MTTFSTIQTLTNEHPPVAKEFVAGDDQSIAQYIAEEYKQQGMDPRAAYDNPDDAIMDFGGLEEFK
ncbi:hypothetical protein [Streptomyces hebeiensis]